jgi:ABC-type bacteriocin/lantibiotic exporter with double-glycine peptidase domain
MDKLLNKFFGRFLPSRLSARAEKFLKNLALLLGLLSAIAIIFDWYPLTMFLSFPFCLIWIYCAWLHTEPQLKWVNLIFLLIYLYGIGLYFHNS